MTVFIKTRLLKTNWLFRRQVLLFCSYSAAILCSFRGFKLPFLVFDFVFCIHSSEQMRQCAGLNSQMLSVAFRKMLGRKRIV